MGRRFLLIDGHPDANRLSGHLLDLYQQALPAGTALDRIAIRDLDFNPDLSRGYHDIPPLEPDLARALDLIEACDHLVLAVNGYVGTLEKTIAARVMPINNFVVAT